MLWYVVFCCGTSQSALLKWAKSHHHPKRTIVRAKAHYGFSVIYDIQIESTVQVDMWACGNCVNASHTHLARGNVYPSPCSVPGVVTWIACSKWTPHTRRSGVLDSILHPRIMCILQSVSHILFISVRARHTHSHVSVCQQQSFLCSADTHTHHTITDCGTCAMRLLVALNNLHTI